MQSYCYLSTPKHVRSFIGQFLYIYTDKGEVSLPATGVRFVGKSGIPMDIPLTAIMDIQVGHYSRWAKPFGLDYIAIRFQDQACERTVLLTPTRSWRTATWETNKIVSQWVGLIREAMSRRT